MIVTIRVAQEKSVCVRVCVRSRIYIGLGEWEQLQFLFFIVASQAENSGPVHKGEKSKEAFFH